MLCVFRLLFASQFVLASSFKNGMKTLLKKTGKTAPEAIKSKNHTFLTMGGQKASRGAFLLGHNQAKCKRVNFISDFLFEE